MEIVVKILDHRIELFGNHEIRSINVGRLDHVVEYFQTDSLLLLEFFLLQYAALNTVNHIGNTVEIAKGLGKIIIKFRQTDRLDLVEFYIKIQLLTGHIFAVIVLRSDQGKVFLFVLLHSDKIFFETGDEMIFAQHHRMVLAHSSVDGIASGFNLKINFDPVAVSGRAVFVRIPASGISYHIQGRSEE